MRLLQTMIAGLLSFTVVSTSFANPPSVGRLRARCSTDLNPSRCFELQAAQYIDRLENQLTKTASVAIRAVATAEALKRVADEQLAASVRREMASRDIAASRENDMLYGVLIGAGTAYAIFAIASLILVTQ